MKKYRKWSWDEAGIGDGKEFIAWEQVRSFAVGAGGPPHARMSGFDLRVTSRDGTSIWISEGSPLRRILGLQVPYERLMGILALAWDAEGHIIHKAGPRLAEEFRHDLAVGGQIAFEAGRLSADGVAYGPHFVPNDRIRCAQRKAGGTIWVGCLDKDSRPWVWPLSPRDNVFLLERHFLSIAETNKPSLARDILERNLRMDFCRVCIDRQGIELKAFRPFGGTRRIPWHAFLNYSLVGRDLREPCSRNLELTYLDQAGEVVHEDLGRYPEIDNMDLACAYLQALRLAAQAGETAP